MILFFVHVWKKGKCRHEQLQFSPLPAPLPASCPHPSVLSVSSLPLPRQRLVTLQSGMGGLSLPLSRSSLSPSLSHSLYKWRLSVFIVQRVTRQPADGGLPWPRWTSGASFRNGCSRCDSQPHRLGSPRYHSWGILLRATSVFCLSHRFLSISIGCFSLGVLKTKKAWINLCCMLLEIFFAETSRWIYDWFQLKMNCVLDVSSQLVLL